MKHLQIIFAAFFITAFISETTGRKANTGRNVYSTKTRRIIGGVDTKIEKFPWIVQITTTKTKCGGSILSEFFVLTAGHCFGENFRASEEPSTVTYSNNEPLLRPLRKGADVDIVKVSTHPNVDINDIAIAKLAKAIRFSASARPVKLRTYPGRVNDEATIGGWGRNETITNFRVFTLQTRTVKILHINECKKKTEPHLRPQLDHTITCSTYGGCWGDSGGPLMANNGVQIGIIRGQVNFNCTNPEVPMMYVNVHSHRTFINFYSENTAQWID